MTFKRYEALKRSWREVPPLPFTALAIAKCLGLEMRAAPDPPEQAQSSEVYFDEGYYENTVATPWRADGSAAMRSDFAAAGGDIK